MLINVIIIIINDTFSPLVPVTMGDLRPSSQSSLTRQTLSCTSMTFSYMTSGIVTDWEREYIYIYIFIIIIIIIINI